MRLTVDIRYEQVPFGYSMKLMSQRAIYDAVLQRSGVDLPLRPTSTDLNDSNVHAGFRLRMENHIRDVKQGKPWRSIPVNNELRDKHRHNIGNLARFDGGTLRRYVGLLSGLPYSQQARLAATMNDVARTLDGLEQQSKMKSLNEPLFKNRS